MDITPALAEGAPFIQGYGPGRFRIRGVVYEGPLGVFVDKAVVWHVDDAGQGLRFRGFSEFVKAKDEIDILLVGTGERFIPLAADLRKALRDEGLCVDAMDTGAACRTFNVLLAEGRRVAAALLPVAV
ncbi:MAG: hypothetical protein EOM26_02525 [Alphaproteobacteria bacterium]|nr:hypothetical protein [Alphaproteobacteria bacterium]